MDAKVRCLYCIYIDIFQLQLQNMSISPLFTWNTSVHTKKHGEAVGGNNVQNRNEDPPMQPLSLCICILWDIVKMFVCENSVWARSHTMGVYFLGSLCCCTVTLALCSSYCGIFSMCFFVPLNAACVPQPSGAEVTTVLVERAQSSNLLIGSMTDCFHKCERTFNCYSNKQMSLFTRCA